MAGFFASKPNTKRNLLLFGCCACHAFAEELCPINASTSIFPDCIIGDAKALPLPYTMFTTHFGKLSLKASNNGDINSTPNLAGLKMAVFPMINAGINKQKASFKG